jgi:hypothetical protein
MMGLFSKRKSTRKGFQVGAIVAILTPLVALATFIPPEAQPYVVAALAGIVKALFDWLKHR